MKKILAFSAMALTSSMALAQTCGSPMANITEPGTFSANTCTDGSAQFNTLCNGGTQVDGRSVVYALNVGANNTFTATVTPSGGYDAAVFIVGPAANCAAFNNAPCPGGNANQQDNAGPDGAETIDLPDNQPEGLYHVVVTSTAGGGASAPDCGPFSLTITPTLPVELQSFSVD
jgi:hypothetical protein